MTGTKKTNERRLLWLLAAVQLTMLLDFMVLMPLGPELMRVMNLSTGGFGGLVSTYTLASAVAGFSGAFWLDRVGHKRAMLVLYAAFVAATASCGAVSHPTWLLVSRIVAGAAAGLLWAVVMAVIVEVVPEERRGSAIGLVMTSYAVSAVAGVPLGLAIASALGWRAPFFSIAALSLVLRCALLRIVPAGQTEKAASRRRDSMLESLRVLVSPRLALGWALTFCVVFSGFLLIPYLSAFMVGNLGIESSKLGLVYLCGGAATLGTSRLVGHLVDRFGPPRVLAVLLLATIVPHLLFTHLRDASLAVVIGVFVLFMTLTSGRLIPTMALITSRVPPTLRGRYLAVNTATSDSSAGIAAWASGLFLGIAPSGALSGFGTLGLCAVAVTGLALALLAVLVRTAGAAPARDGESSTSDGLAEASGT
jgi:predicted MFS family arabinose efflux permease